MQRVESLGFRLNPKGLRHTDAMHIGSKPGPRCAYGNTQALPGKSSGVQGCYVLQQCVASCMSYTIKFGLLRNIMDRNESRFQRS